MSIGTAEACARLEEPNSKQRQEDYVPPFQGARFTAWILSPDILIQV